MKLLFITDFLSESHFGREPLGLLYIISVLRENGININLFDISEVSKNNIKIRKFSPDIVAYSIKTGFHKKFIDFNKELKNEFNFISLFGGPHPTFYPEMINSDGVDIICRSEAEGTIMKLLSGIAKGDYVQTEGFWIKYKQKVHKNPIGPLIEDLDTIPFPDRSILEKYSLFKNFRMRNFISSRGCPYSCGYCHNYALRKLYKDKGNGTYMRRRSVNNLVDEIEYETRRSNLNFINFEDDIFVQDKGWLKEFGNQYSKKIGIPFHCHVKADMFDEEEVSLLRKAGCFSVSLGVESSNEEIRENILFRKMSSRLIVDRCTILKSYGINIALQNMLGIPHTSLSSDLNTLKFNIKCRADYSITGMFTPYPGTKVAEIFPFNDWDRVGNYYSFSVYQITHKKERENLQKLFALVVRFPFLFKSLPWLIKLPFGRFYSFIVRFCKYFWGRKNIFPTGFSRMYNLLYIKKVVLGRNNE